MKGHVPLYKINDTCMIDSLKKKELEGRGHTNQESDRAKGRRPGSKSSAGPSLLARFVFRPAWVALASGGLPSWREHEYAANVLNEST
jgi:hypothetical protein